MKFFTLILLAATLAAQSGTPQASAPAAPAAVKPTAAAVAKPSPISEKLRADIAKAQRDSVVGESTMRDAVETYNAAKAQMDTANQALTTTLFPQAEKACADAKQPGGPDQTFDKAGLICVEKKPPPPQAGDPK